MDRLLISKQQLNIGTRTMRIDRDVKMQLIFFESLFSSRVARCDQSNAVNASGRVNCNGPMYKYQVLL